MACMSVLLFIALRINFRIQPKVCDGFHDIISMSFNDVAVVTVRGNDYKTLFGE